MSALTKNVPQKLVTSSKFIELATILGSRLIDGQSQNKTVAARAMAERKTFGHLS
jgi:hypothetical protein